MRPIAWFDPATAEHKNWYERESMDTFNRDLLPFLKKHGSRMGASAMAGDHLAESVIRRYRVFEDAKDPWNLFLLTRLVKNWAEKERL